MALPEVTVQAIPCVPHLRVLEFSWVRTTSCLCTNTSRLTTPMEMRKKPNTAARAAPTWTSCTNPQHACICWELAQPQPFLLSPRPCSASCLLTLVCYCLEWFGRSESPSPNSVPTHLLNAVSNLSILCLRLLLLQLPHSWALRSLLPPKPYSTHTENLVQSIWAALTSW